MEKALLVHYHRECKPGRVQAWTRAAFVYAPLPIAVVVAVVMAAAAFTVQTHAATPTKLVEEVIVTATLTPVSLLESLRPVSVLNHEDIKQAQAASMIELLQRLPGLQFSRTGGAGGNSSLFLRGSNSNHVLVLIDGVRISNANSGATPWNELLPEQIERIEVVRGPRGALYGSDAIGGVVQIFTHDGRAQTKGNTQRISLAGGNRDTIRSSFYFAHNSADLSASLGLSHYDTRGISHRDSGGLNDEDGSRAGTIKISLRSVLSHPESEIRLNYLRSNSVHEFDAFAPPPDELPADIFEENLLESFNMAFGHYVPAARTRYDWRSAVELGYSRNDNESTDPTAVFTPQLSRFNSVRRSMRWVNTINTEKAGSWVAGIEYYRDSVRRNEDIADQSRDNTAGFLEYQYLHARSDVVAFLRLDDNEQFDNYSSIGVDWGFNILPWLKLTASYGTSFHAPTFNDLYGFGGNINLDPEESVNTEIGLRGQHGKHLWAVHIFNNEIEELISVIQIPGAGFNFMAINIQQAHIRGVELEWSSEWERLHVSGSFSWMDPRNLENDSILLRRARRELKVDLGYERADWNFGAALIARSKRYDFCSSGVDNCLGGYSLLSLSAAWKFHPQWQARLQVDNATSKHYRLASGYNMERRSSMLSISWQSP
jgi:vitamin B12 transporter